MKSIVLSFRVKPQQLAKALDGIRQIERSFFPTKLSEIGRKAFELGINATSHNLPIEPSAKSLAVITGLTTQIGQRKGQRRREHYQRTGNFVPASCDPLSQDTDLGSDKSVVDDFSPMTIEEIENE